MDRRLTDFPAQRTVFKADATQWLAANPAAPDCSVITSLPDVSEVPQYSFEGWRIWFIEVARQVIRWVPEGGVAIFFQSDIRHRGAWIDKGYLVMRAAEEERASVVWHKIVCRKPPGTIAQGRASYSHMICISREGRPAPTRPGPDILPDAGFMPWNRAMGEAACRLACRYLRDETATRRILDPFCGQGSVLAAANSFGFEAVGVDLSSRRCRLARELVFNEPEPLTRGVSVGS